MKNPFPLGLGALAAALALAAASRGAEPSPKPNVVFVITDEWRYQATGYAGDPNAHTPALDRFAAQSVNVRNAISGCSVCCPARASLMTGQYPLTDGVYINDVPLVPHGVTLGEAFEQAGYATGYIGKWHLYGSPGGRYERRDSYIPADKRFGFEYWKAAECCHNYNHSFYYEGNDTRMKFWPGYDAIAQTADACQFIHAKAQDPKPFFLMLSLGPPHFPTGLAPEKYRELYRNRPLQLRPNVPAKDQTAGDLAELRGYYENIAAVDDCFQSLLDAIESAGIAENTIVIFTSDHGDMMYSQGLIYKQMPWEESLRVPLLIRYPKALGRTGRISDALTNSPDLMPTLLGLCHLPVPSSLQGTDFSRTLAGDQADPSSTAFISMPVPVITALSFGVAEYRGVRSLRYTYIRSIQGPWLLYDNLQDPYQMHNLCGQAATRDIQRQLERELTAWLNKVGDQFLPAATYLQRDGWTHSKETEWPVRHVSSPWGDWQSTAVAPPRLTNESAIIDLLGNPQSRAIVQQLFPDLIKNPLFNTVPASFASLKGFKDLMESTRMQKMAALTAQITGEKLSRLDEQLAQLPNRL